MERAEAMQSLNKVCYDLHTGQMGFTIVGSDVRVQINFLLTQSKVLISLM